MMPPSTPMRLPCRSMLLLVLLSLTIAEKTGEKVH